MILISGPAIDASEAIARMSLRSSGLRRLPAERESKAPATESRPARWIRADYSRCGSFAPEEAFMRTIAVVSIMFVTLCLTTTGARAGAWCARYPEGASNCGLHSFEQCRAAVSGRGGFCEPNPFSSNGSRTR